jgi:hypothetical protein
MITLSQEQELFLSILEKSLGIVSIALQKAEVSRDEYVFWQDNIEFKRRLDLISDTSVDYVENKLLALINKGDLSAIQFYLKTKGKKRGY